MESPAPKRRWYQFSLRTLFVFVTLCALPCSWLAVKMQQAERQRKAVEAIKKAGGMVEYDWQLGTDGISVRDAKPSGPEWLHGVLGNDLLGVIKLARLFGPQATDAALENVKCMSQLEFLDLWDTRVTDSGLEHLRELRQLKALNLRGTQVTDEGVKKLQRALPNCKIYR